MTEIISVRFKTGGKAYYFNPNGLKFAPGEEVIIETSRGTEFGECVEGNQLIDERELVSPLRPVLRRATSEDRQTLEDNCIKEAEAFAVCQQKIQVHGLDMKLVRVEYSFDGSKILFFFTADGRVDFRALVRDLASVFHTRIELRQIGVRDEAKMLGGLGICGRPYCCAAFLDDFHSVSIKMAKTQNLSLNPAKISGACGRLMCCLKYEQEAYEDVLSRTPKLESLVETPDGVGTVNSVQLLRENVKVRLENEPDASRMYSLDDIRVIRSGKGRRTEGERKPESFDESEESEAPQPAPQPRREAAPASSETTGKSASSGRPQRKGERPASASAEKNAGESGNSAAKQSRRPPRKSGKPAKNPEKSENN